MHFFSLAPFAQAQSLQKLWAWAFLCIF